MKDGGRKDGREERLFHPFSLLLAIRPSVFRLRRMTNPLELFAGETRGREGESQRRDAIDVTYFYGVLLLG